MNLISSFLVYFLFAVLMSCGCRASLNDAPPRRIIEGNVTFNDSPIEYGLIRFIPVQEGAVATAIIENGKYRVANKGGVPLGTARVEITSQPNMAKVDEDSLMNQQPVASIKLPEKFNKNSILSETISQGKGILILNYDLQE